MNPFEILGIREDAGAEQINAAYREKMAFYSDAPGDNSQMIDRLNQAYDSLMYGGASNTHTSSGSSAVKYGDVRAKIRENRLEDAEMILDGVPIGARDGEWYFLKGSVFQKRGWLEDAAEAFEKAARLEPGNAEFQAAADNVRAKRQGDYRNDWRQSTQNSGCADSMCKLCTAIACCDCLCSLCR